MAYDFDWDGTTLAIGDDETNDFVLPQDPTGNQAGVDAPAFLSSNTDLVNFGVFNGNFRFGPPDLSQNVDVASSTAGSNFMRGWRFVQSSNTAVTLRQVRDASSPSGSNLRFTFASGAAADAAYVEQIIDVGGIAYGQTGDLLYVAGKTTSGTGLALRARTQYLSTDGSLVGMPAEKVATAAGTTTDLSRSIEETTASAPPGNARFLRLRVEAYRTAGTGAGAIDLVDLRRVRGVIGLPLLDQTGASTLGTLSYLTNTEGKASVRQRGAVSPVTAMRLGYKLVALPFAYVDMPAGATTELRPVDGGTGIGTTPRLHMPWAGHIVGMTYRMTDSATAGTWNLRATVNGANVWSPFGPLGSGAAPGGQTTQPLGSDTFSAGDEIGVDCVTSAGYLPTTRDFNVLLWVALEFDS